MVTATGTGPGALRGTQPDPRDPQTCSPLPLPATHLVPVHELEAQDVLQLPKADGAEVRGPPQGLVQAEGALHEAAEPAAVPQAQEVAELVARDLREKVPTALHPGARHPPIPGTPGCGENGKLVWSALGASEHGGLGVR